MNAQPDFGALKRQWQSAAPPLPDIAALRERVSADTKAHWRALFFVMALTVLILAGSLAYALRSPNEGAWLSFGFSTLFATLVWSVALWMSRGTWRPRDDTIAAALDLSIRRCHSMILAAPVGIALYVLGLVGSLAWKDRLFGVDWSTLLGTPAMIVAGWIGAPLYAAGMLWNARRQRARLKVLIELKRQLFEG
ncbi:MAG: hypothetical protein DIU62_002335 [Pseudomonadota bacterium]|jgi:hypothetical protein|nr:MAG: hypothetical protein DIU62_05865 [Pseudomonadota bacterium]